MPLLSLESLMLLPSCAGCTTSSPRWGPSSPAARSSSRCRPLSAPAPKRFEVVEQLAKGPAPQGNAHRFACSIFQRAVMRHATGAQIAGPGPYSSGLPARRHTRGGCAPARCPPPLALVIFQGGGNAHKVCVALGGKMVATAPVLRVNAGRRVASRLSGSPSRLSSGSAPACPG